MAIQNLDLSRLSLKDALDLAILIEEEAHERYGELCGQMEEHRTLDAARFFRFMAANEAKHGFELAARRRQLFGEALREVSRAMIFDVEAPDYDEARAFMSAREALGVAMRCEAKAYAFFVGCIPHLTNPEVRRLFEELRDEEIQHQELVRAELMRLPPGTEPDAEAFVDEPTSQ